MTFLRRPRFLRGVIIFSLAAALALITCYGILLLIESFSPNGSPSGNALLFTLSFVLIIPSTAAIIFLIFHWKSSPPEDNPKNNRRGSKPYAQ